MLTDKEDFSRSATIMNQSNVEGQTPLHLAVAGSHFDVVKLLLERGGDVNQRMDGDESVLHMTATTGSQKLTQLILTHGAEVDAVNEIGRTPLHKAARYGKYEIVAMLLKRYELNIFFLCFPKKAIHSWGKKLSSKKY